MKKIILQIIIISGAIFVFFSQANAANHDFTGLPLAEDGWTDFESMIQSNGYQNSRVVFVALERACSPVP